MEIKNKPNSVVHNVPDVFSEERIRISEPVFEELAKAMNIIHGVNYSYRFWKIVMSDYVNALVSIKHILEAKEMATKPSLMPVNSHHVPTLKQKLLARLPAIIKHFKTLGNRKIIFNILSQSNSISIALPVLEVVRKETGPMIPEYYPIFPGKGNQEKRKTANRLAEKYDSVFYKNMVLQIPAIYVEYYDGLFNSIPLIGPSNKIFHIHGLPPLYNSLIIAKYIENGAKLICYQHGAYYGEMQGHNSHFNEASIADEFRTWGWKIRDNDVPWKAYRMEKFKEQYTAAQHKTGFDFLMCYPDIFYANIDFYKSVTDYFLSNIDTEKYSRIMARPRPMNKIFSHAGRLSFIKDSRVTVASGLENMADAMATCRLVIQFTVPATNFMECLYVDHPTMGVLDNAQPTSIIKPYYDFFLQHGVLHNDFVSLVAHLNKININEWWQSLIKEPLYLQFKNEFIHKV